MPPLLGEALSEKRELRNACGVVLLYVNLWNESGHHHSVAEKRLRVNLSLEWKHEMSCS